MPDTQVREIAQSNRLPANLYIWGTPVVVASLSIICMSFFFDTEKQFSWLWLPNAVGALLIAVGAIRQNRKQIALVPVIFSTISMYLVNGWIAGFNLNAIVLSGLNGIEIGVAAYIFFDIHNRLGTSSSVDLSDEIKRAFAGQLLLTLAAIALLASSYFHNRFGAPLVYGFGAWLTSNLVAYIPISLLFLSLGRKTQRREISRLTLLAISFVLCYELLDLQSNSLVYSTLLMAAWMIVAALLLRIRCAGYTIIGLFAFHVFNFSNGTTLKAEELDVLNFNIALMGIELTAALVAVIVDRGRGLTRKVSRALDEANIEKEHLALAKQRLSLALDAGHMGIWEYDLDTGKLLWDQEMYHLYGVDDLNIEPDYELWRSSLHPQDRLSAEASIQTAINEQSPFTSEFRIVRSSGEVLWISAKALIHQDSNRRRRMIGYNQDITEQVTARIRIEESQAQQQRMFAVIGHELRTPAAALKMLLENLEVQTLAGMRSTLNSTIDQMIQVLDDLRLVAQPNEVVECSTATEEPASILTKTGESLRPLLSQHGIELHIAIRDGAGFKCNFSLKALKQLTSNLLKNVAIHSHGANAWVELSVVSKSDNFTEWLLTVEDDGCGVAPNHRAKLFDQFYRVDKNTEGTGLGLSICQSTSALLGGTVAYFESPHGGAGFSVNMKLDNASMEPPVEEKQPTLRDNLEGLHILLAEDNLTIRMLTKAMFEKAGAKVSVAENGLAALEMFNNGDPVDLLVTDIFMPEMDGYGLTKALRLEHKGLPIIGVTAATVGKETDELIKAGANAAIGKPISMQGFLKTLQSIGTLG